MKLLARFGLIAEFSRRRLVLIPSLIIHLVIVVDVSPEIQVERLVGQRGMSADQARARMAAQATREQRVAIADIVIDNSGTLADLDRRVAQVWADLHSHVAR